MTGQFLTEVSLFTAVNFFINISTFLYNFYFSSYQQFVPPCCDLVYTIRVLLLLLLYRTLYTIRVLLEAFSLHRLKSLLNIPYWLWNILNWLEFITFERSLENPQKHGQNWFFLPSDTQWTTTLNNPGSPWPAINTSVAGVRGRGKVASVALHKAAHTQNCSRSASRCKKHLVLATVHISSLFLWINPVD